MDNSVGGFVGRELYKIGIHTDRYEAFTKNAYIFDKEKGTNLALILSGSLHKQDAGYGYKLYNVDQKNLYTSLMFETNFDERNSISAGLSLNYDYFNQTYRLENDDTGLLYGKEKETVPGAYVQYTYNWKDKIILMGGFVLIIVIYMVPLYSACSYQICS